MSASWQALAACGDVDPELFFPVGVSGLVYEAQVRAAKAVCAGCTVRAECLAHALRALPQGIAGGLTAEERRGLGVDRPTLADVGSRPAGATRLEIGEAGRAAIRAGRAVAEVAAEFGVSLRTAERWAERVRAGERGAA